MKASYKNRKIDGLFSYYPIEPLKSGPNLQGQIDRHLLAWGAKILAGKMEADCPPMVDLKTMIGIEIEAEGVSSNIANGVPCWNIITDDSLRNNGREFVTPPVTPEVARQALIALYATFRKAEPDFSWRTSTHVHLNMREDKVEQVMCLLLLYILFEDSLFSFVGDDRRQSNFCVPVQETNLSYTISRILSGKQTLPALCEIWQKYTALNPRPLCFNDHAGGGPGGSHTSGKGTIEFRHLEGTANLTKVVNWINLILCLQKFARQTNLEELEGRILSVMNRQDYVNFIHDVFQEYAELLPVKGFQRILYSSVAYAKECFCPIPNVEKLVKAGRDRQTGLAEMIKIRTRGKPVPSTDVKKNVNETVASHWAFIQGQMQQIHDDQFNSSLQGLAQAIVQPVPTVPVIPGHMWNPDLNGPWPGNAGNSVMASPEALAVYPHGHVMMGGTWILNHHTGNWEHL